MNLDALKDDLRHAEGFRDRPYLDTVGVWTIGYGHAMPAITREEVATLRWTREHAAEVLEQDMAAAIHDAGTYPWWRTLDPVRQAAIVELLFNLGRTKFNGFAKMISALQNRQYQKAARELLDSKWRIQVGPKRSARLALAIERGDG
jgi:lysozyme